jgi:flagellar biosynthetic protein FliR
MRVLGFTLTAPVLGSRLIPAQAKIALCGLIAFLLNTTQAPVTPAASDLGIALLAGQEGLVGAVIGLACNLVFSAMQMAGQILGLSIGFGMSHLFDPLSGTQESNIEQLFLVTSTLIFLTLGGHHVLLLSLGRTFVLLPPGQAPLAEFTAAAMATLTGQLFGLAVRIALPVVGTLLLTDVVLGMLSRVLPQMSILFVAFPLKIGLGLLTLLYALPGMTSIFARLIGSIPANAMGALGGWR